MKLLSIDEIQAGFDAEFKPLEPMLTGFRLVEKELSGAAINKLESDLGVSLPDDMSDLISCFDFGQLTIGPVAFCASGDYLEELRSLDETRWWGNSVKPDGLILIANSDPYAILLNVNTGDVYAFDASVSGFHPLKVASSFSGFFRGLGTAILLRAQVPTTSNLAEFIHQNVNGEDLSYWQKLVQ